MSSVAKLYQIPQNSNLDISMLHSFIFDYYNGTKLEPNLIKISRGAFMNLMLTMYNVGPMTLPLGKRYALHLPTAYGIIPIVGTDENPYMPHGFVSIDDTKFDEEFEKIVLTDEEKK